MLTRPMPEFADRDTWRNSPLARRRPPTRRAHRVLLPAYGSRIARLGLAAAMVLALIAGCAGQQAASPAPAAGSAPASRVVRAADGTEGELIGAPAPGSKFARVQIGMTERQVEAAIGPPSDTDTHITGKSFIPFYFGGDTHRLEAFYKGEGILTYAPAHFAGQANTLIRIIADPSETGVPH